MFEDFDEEDYSTQTLYQTMRRHMDAVPVGQRNAETLAKAAYAAIRETSAEWGQNPDIECFLKAPGEEAYDGERNRWLVCWESGPYQWGTSVSMSLPYGLTEPYYSFDLSFYPNEDYR